MLIDKHGMRWNNLEEWCRTIVCNSTKCMSCPFSSKANKTGLGCLEYIQKYPEEALKVALDSKIMREESPVRLCNILGVEVGEEFFFKNKKYLVNKDGHLTIQKEFGLWSAAPNAFEGKIALEEMIQNPELVQKEPSLTCEQQEALKQVKKMLPKAKRIFQSNEGLKVEFDMGFAQWAYELNLDVEMPKKLDYEFEEEEDNNGDKH